MSKADQMLFSLVGREGRYANHPSDRGGETMWGITVAVARAFGYEGPMSAMPRETAVRIYRLRYWIEPGFDLVSMHSEAVAEELLDTGVNMGVEVACKFFQRALNVFNLGATIYPDLMVDGRVGSMTLAAFVKYLQHRGNASGEKVMLSALNALQGARYIALAEGAVSQEDFVYGWFDKRIGSLQ